MKTISEICTYCVWFLKVLGLSAHFAGLPPFSIEEQIAMLTVGVLVGGVIVLATSAVVTEVLWQAVRRLMSLPDDWTGAVTEDESHD